MSRTLTRSLQVVVDLLVLSVALWLAFLFRFEFRIPREWAHVALTRWPFVIALTYAVLLAAGVHRYAWRYISLREILRIGPAVALAALVLAVVRLVSGDITPDRVLSLPLGVLAMYTVLAFLLLVGARATRRVQGEAQERRRRATDGTRHRVLLIGAGQAGVMVARELAGRPDLGLDAVGFLDDDKRKVGTHIGGLPVLGTSDQLVEIAERKRAKRALITIASAPGADIRRIALRARDAGIDTKIIPGIYEIVGDRVNLSRIRDVAIEDLLGREPVSLDEAVVAASLRGRTVLVTGAGGSIGSELCRQVARYAPARLVLVERFENALFEIHRELRHAFPELTLDARVADITDATRMGHIFRQARPDAVFHAAAHKHVPMMEENPGEAIKNNIGGTRVVAQLAAEVGVGQFVMISTDKAVNPSSVMGASKRAAELQVQAVAGTGPTRFVTVRFGNVLGSNGSVVPIFKEQIARGGPVTITHPEMSRYFMTIPEASQLVLQAGAMGKGSEIFILDMGQPVKIVDLANDLIRLSGLEPGRDIEIEFTGVRAGEKLFEELATDAEHADKTQHPKIFIGRIAAADRAAVDAQLAALLAAADRASGDELRAALRALVPEYKAPRPGMARGETPIAGTPAVTEAAPDNTPEAAGAADAARTTRASGATLAVVS
ncbi:MAG: polysaccharide biosynthesis protein [Kofleriaceae bacterium]|nr:polysaccharide biosynthesis protein [Kofleriaceae bacterium]MBP6840862.1 polysaccharide biosynthesis protein [Kofleriaceae bacterium]MBP9208624.1 polysaccharide biosynthesis protein [Kofleriaceae bacterium]